MSIKKCIILVGVPAAGKSTYIAEMYPDAQVISTDNVLDNLASFEGLTYNEAFIKYMDLAEKIMWEELVEAAEKDVSPLIIDRTNMSIKARARFIERLKPYGYEFEAVAFAIPEEREWNRRLSSRPGKTIPRYVLDSMIKSFQMPSELEGFKTVIPMTDT